MPIASIKSKFSVALILALAFGQPVRAQTCENLFNDVPQTESKKELINPFAYDKNSEPFTQILNDKDLPLAGKILDEARKQDGVPFKEALINTLRKYNYTEDIIQERIAQAETKFTHTESQWRKILGDLSLKETQKLFYGGDLHAITTHSLIGQYIAKTGAKTAFRSFATKPDGKTKGDEKLVIAVSPESFNDFKKLILSNMHFMSVVGHANVLHQGAFYSFGGGKKSAIEQLGAGTPIPLLLLKSSEAQRVSRYMDLTTKAKYMGWDHAIKQPWLIKDYCAEGGFSCCTHWLGNIPIGDKLVNEYSFPPEDYADDRSPRTQVLNPYKINRSNQAVASVWKAPGHQQLADVIGQRRANLNGEMASPGYVIHTLIGPTSAERVPVIFLMTMDHTAEIAETPYLRYERAR